MTTLQREVIKNHFDKRQIEKFQGSKEPVKITAVKTSTMAALVINRISMFSDFGENSKKNDSNTSNSLSRPKVIVNAIKKISSFKNTIQTAQEKYDLRQPLYTTNS